MEALTDELERRVDAELAAIDERGGAVAAIAEGYQANEIGDAAYATQRAIEAGERIVVGVNRYADGSEVRPEPQRIDPAAEAEQIARTRAVREGRDPAAADAALAALTEAAAGTENVLPRMRACVETGVTLGEISHALRSVGGEHRG